MGARADGGSDASRGVWANGVKGGRRRGRRAGAMTSEDDRLVVRRSEYDRGPRRRSTAVEYGRGPRARGWMDARVHPSRETRARSSRALVPSLPARLAPASRMDLVDALDARGCFCLNATADDAWRNAVIPPARDDASARVTSDDDHEMILCLRFAGATRVRRCAFGTADAGAEAEAEASGADEIALFVNGAPLSFDNVGRRRPTQVIRGEGEHALDVSAFDGVTTLYAHVRSNRGKTARTTLARFAVFGDVLHGTNVNELKPC